MGPGIGIFLKLEGDSNVQRRLSVLVYFVSHKLFLMDLCYLYEYFYWTHITFMNTLKSYVSQYINLIYLITKRNSNKLYLHSH